MLGTAVGAQNGSAALGIAPSSGTGSNIAKPFYLNFSGGNELPVDAFSDAVRLISNLASDYAAHTGIAASSIGYLTSHTTLFPTLGDAFNYGYYQANTLWFVAAGNTAPVGGFVVVPGQFASTVAVGALERVGGALTRASFSASGPKIELVAPGKDVHISWNTGSGASWMLQSGTSFAAPAAMGVARLALQKYPSWTAAQLRQEMRDHARNLGPAGKDNDYGYGMVDAYCLVQQVSPCVP